jgi:hypothetical protein
MFSLFRHSLNRAVKNNLIYNQILMVTGPFSNFYDKNLNKVKIVYISYFKEFVKLSFYFFKAHTIYKLS